MYLFYYVEVFLSTRVPIHGTDTTLFKHIKLSTKLHFLFIGIGEREKGREGSKLLYRESSCHTSREWQVLCETVGGLATLTLDDWLRETRVHKHTQQKRWWRDNRRNHMTWLHGRHSTYFGGPVVYCPGYLSYFLMSSLSI